MVDTTAPQECLDDHGQGECQGPVDYWTTGSSLRGWPRCDYHGMKRQERYENSIEQYADSDVAPSWFDASYAGERWDEDY